MTEQRIPRWDFEVRVNTPDHQVLHSRISASPDYMDGSLVEHLVGTVRAEIVRELRATGYLN